MNFSDLGLSPEALQAVADAGYVAPTPIQEQAIPYVLMGRDVLGCAQTGTGKTAGFTLPMIDILSSGRSRARMPRSLIIEPTRELAAQVAEAFEVYGKHSKLSQALLIGGESFTDQERKLDRGVDVLIATPGRLIDLFERGKILLSDVKVLVIDEADRMLDMGFIPDVERIVGLLPRIRQTLFFSATMPPEIRRLADAFLSNPKEVSVAPPASPAETVTQNLVVVEPEDKRDALRRLIRNEDVKNAIIFCNRKRDVDILFKSLTRHGFDAVALHGDMPQAKRTETLERFRNNEVRLLVASDVAARGLDIQGLSHVFNFDVPIHAEDYVHRIGRTGRAGREGRAFTLAAPEDGRAVAAIAKLIGKEIPTVTLEGIAAAELVYDDVRRRHRGAAASGERKPRDRSRSPARRSRAPRESAEPPVPTVPSVAPPAALPTALPLVAAEATGAEARAQGEAPMRSSTASRGKSEGRGRSEGRGKGEGRGKSEPREPRQGRRAPAARPITMDPTAIDAAGGNVTPLPLAAQRDGQRGERRRDERHEADQDGDDHRVIGFGDHLPAFLARPVRRVAQG